MPVPLLLPNTKCRRNSFSRVNITSYISAGGYYECIASDLEYTLKRLAIISQGMYKKNPPF